MCIVLVILKLSLFCFVAEDPGVLDEEVLLHLGDQFWRFRNIEIRILPVNMCIVPRYLSSADLEGGHICPPCLK